MKGSTKFLVLATVLMLVAAPAMADEHLNETESDEEPEDDSDIEEEEDENETESEDELGFEGTDNSTELSISGPEAERTALSALSDNDWLLEDSSINEEEGYYEYEFVVSGEDAEAEVRVDGSSGEVFRLEEELEQEEDSEGESSDRAVQARIESKEAQIERYRERISELEEEIEQLRETETLEDSEAEAEVELERDGNETEIEAEAEDGDREVEVEAEGPSENAQENVNGTPGSEQAQDRRPGFVSRMLGGFFN